VDFNERLSQVNRGEFKGDTYTKKVQFSKAVLWKNRELSLRGNIIQKIKLDGIKKIIFIDAGKKERWIFDAEKVLLSMKFKTIGQEGQWYFTIDLAKKEEIK